MSLQSYSKVPTEAELKSYQMVADVAANNPHWRKLGGNGKPEEVTATILSVMLLARELGFSPMQAVSGGFNNIQGKFEISARLMNQAIRNRGHQIKLLFLSDELCKIWGKRKDTNEEMTVVYSIEEARRSNLVRDGGPWTKIPQDMLFARAISRLARRLYPDCIGNCYVEGEILETSKKEILENVETVPQDEMPEIECKVISLALPEGISREKVETFIRQTAEQTQRSVEDINKRASANPDSFLKAYLAWEGKNIENIEEKELASAS